MAESKPTKTVDREESEPTEKSGPSGATTRLEERESKFDEEGGAQPQAASEHEADEALSAIRNAGEHDDKGQVPVAGKHNQQSPQLKNGK